MLRTLVEIVKSVLNLSDANTDTLVMYDESSSTSVQEKTFTKEQLKNMVVTKISYLTRPLSGLDSRNKLGLAIAPSVLHHAGVLIDIEGGRQLLIHRAGKSPTSEFEYSDTVVEDWDNMDKSLWKVQDSEILERNRTAYDVWKHGLPTKKYNLFLANCQHAANRMFTKGK